MLYYEVLPQAHNVIGNTHAHQLHKLTDSVRETRIDQIGETSPPRSHTTRCVLES